MVHVDISRSTNASTALMTTKRKSLVRNQYSNDKYKKEEGDEEEEEEEEGEGKDGEETKLLKKHNKEKRRRGNKNNGSRKRRDSTVWARMIATARMHYEPQTTEMSTTC